MAEAPAGRFMGVERGGAVAWLGVRYARAERFGLPEPAERTSGPVDAIRLGAACPQRVAFNTPEQIGPSQSEDCLNLTIFSPGADDARRPVMVWLHGGAFVGGSATLYDGSDFAASGDMVVVVVNYRLGLLGFLGLEAEGVPANLGLRDQIAALAWVRDNIAAFGGDPQRVTLAGESAGSMSTSLLMIAPAAAGLFHGAIMQSGALNLIHDRATARALGARLRALLGDDGGDLARLRALPVDRLLDAQAQLDREFPDIVPAAPCYDGDLLPASFAEARARPTMPVPLLAGHNRDESRIFELKALRGVLPIRRTALERLMTQQFGAARTAAILAAYPAGRAGERALASDINFAMPTRHFAERHAARGAPAWFYRFDCGGPLLGAAHGLELAYLWGWAGLRLMLFAGGPMWGARRRLARRMRDAWIAFVRTGDPGAGWPRFDPAGQAVRLFDRTDSVAADPDGARRRAWSGDDVHVAAGTADIVAP